MAAALTLPGCDRMTARSGVDPALVRSDAPRRLEVLVLGHADSAHDARAFAPMLAAALGKDGINISYAEDGARPLAPYDAIVLFARPPELAPEEREAIARFVADGRGLVGVHFGADAGTAEHEALRVLAGLPPDPDVASAADMMVRRAGSGRVLFTAAGHDRAKSKSGGEPQKQTATARGSNRRAGSSKQRKG